MSFRTGRLDRCTNIENSVRIKPSKGFRYFVGYKSSVKFISLGGFNSPVGFKSPVGLLSSCSPPHPLWGFVSQRKLTTSAWETGILVRDSKLRLSFQILFFSFFLPFFHEWTTDLTHVTCELQSSSAHHSLWLSGRASYSICRIPFYNRTFFLLSINSKTVNGDICTLSLPQRVFVFYLHSLVRVHCINLQPLVTKPLAKLRTPVLNRVRTKKM